MDKIYIDAFVKWLYFQQKEKEIDAISIDRVIEYLENWRNL